MNADKHRSEETIDMWKKRLIKSVSDDQQQIIRDICSIHCKEWIELDVTWGRGNVFKGIRRPKYRFDIDPRDGAGGCADVRALPIKNHSIRSVIFDPPFLACGGPSGCMTGKYGWLNRPADVWLLYQDGLLELDRILMPQGVLIVKCQDMVNGRTQYMTHVAIANMATGLGLYLLDLFIYVARQRPIQWNQKTQHHARKYHSYFWVFRKRGRKTRVMERMGIERKELE